MKQIETQPDHLKCVLLSLLTLYSKLIKVSIKWRQASIDRWAAEIGAHALSLAAFAAFAAFAGRALASRVMYVGTAVYLGLPTPDARMPGPSHLSLSNNPAALLNMSTDDATR